MSALKKVADDVVPGRKCVADMLSRFSRDSRLRKGSIAYGDDSGSIYRALTRNVRREQLWKGMTVLGR